MPRLDVERYVADARYSESLRELTESGSIGGVCIFGGTPETVLSTLAELDEVRGKAGHPRLLCAADCEFGLPMRLLSGGTEFPDAMALAMAESTRTRNAQEPDSEQTAVEASAAYEAAACIGREMALIGLDWNFAPVADINSNPGNPIINTRSFGENAEIVSVNAGAYMAGLRSAGVLATAKHFPGHGDTSQDSHSVLPYLNYSLQDFEKRELLPFKTLIANSVDAVMTAHVAAPALARELGARDEDLNRPATLSHVLTTTLLRDRLRFEGVVVTDALEMHAITNEYSERLAAQYAFSAGSDMLLMPNDVRVAHAAIMEIAGANIEALEQKLGRLQRLSRRLPKRAANSTSTLDAFRQQAAASHVVSTRLAAQALRLEGAIGTLNDADLVVLTDDREAARRKAERFIASVKEGFHTTTLLTFAEASSKEFDRQFVLATFHRARGYIGGTSMAADANQVVARIAEMNAHKVRGLVLIGSPYLDAHFVGRRPAIVLKTFSEAATSVEAAAHKLLRIKSE
jgi:beta-glucosidase-like glycosyl hydrolase